MLRATNPKLHDCRVVSVARFIDLKSLTVEDPGMRASRALSDGVRLGLEGFAFTPRSGTFDGLRRCRKLLHTDLKRQAKGAWSVRSRSAANS